MIFQLEESFFVQAYCHNLNMVFKLPSNSQQDAESHPASAAAAKTGGRAAKKADKKTATTKDAQQKKEAPLLVRESRE